MRRKTADAARASAICLAAITAGSMLGGCAIVDDFVGWKDMTPPRKRGLKIPQPRPVRGWPDGTPHATRVGLTILCGQPDEAGLRHAAALGITTVVNVREASEMEALGFDEEALVATLGMKYRSDPIPPEGDFATVYHRTHMDVPTWSGGGSPRVLIHDATGDRVGALWAIYTSTRYHRTADEAVEAGRKAGLHSTAMIEAVRRAIEPWRYAGTAPEPSSD